VEEKQENRGPCQKSEKKGPAFHAHLKRFGEKKTVTIFVEAAECGEPGENESSDID